MKLYSKQSGDIQVSHELPAELSSHRIPESYCTYAAGSYGHLIFQEIDLKEVLIRFTTVLPTLKSSQYENEEIMIMEDHEAIVLQLSLEHSLHYFIDGWGDVVFHERGFNMYSIPPLTSSFFTGKYVRSEFKMFISLPFAQQLAKDHELLSNVIRKSKIHKSSTIKPYNQVASWGMMEQVERLKNNQCEIFRSELAAHFLHHALETMAVKPCKRPSILTQDDVHILYETRKIMLTNLNKTFTRKELIQMSGLKPYKFDKGFHEIFGKSAFGLLTEHRMKLATWLLQDQQDLTIDRIASETGYTDLSLFVKAFKRFYGLNPTNFRKNQKNNTLVSE